MRNTSWAVVVAAALAGCQVGPLDPLDGGQSGTAIPPHCVEDLRIAVTDPAAPADGMDFAAADALAAVEGLWEGSAEIAGGGPATVHATVTWDGGAIDAVFSHLEGDVQDDTGSQMGALGAPSQTTDEMCSPVYELGFTLSVVADPYLDVAGAARTTVGSSLALDLPVEIAEADVGGTLEAPTWDHPEFWDRTVVMADFGRYPDASAALNLEWLAINDDPVQSSGTATTSGGGQAGTGSVEPSGMTSPIAYVMGLVRQ